MNGYGFFKSLGSFLKKIWKPLLAILVAVILQRYELIPKFLALLGTPAKLIQPLASGISSGVTNVIATGKPKAFLSGFGQGYATFGVAGLPLGRLTRAVAHAVVGGAFSEIRGGSFKSGFLAAGFSSAVAPYAPANEWAGAAFNAAAGGVGSVLGGGKFADGAVTGAFQYLAVRTLSNARPALASDDQTGVVKDPAERQAIFDRARGELIENGLLPADADLRFVNRYAVGREGTGPDGAPNVSDIRTFETFDQARAAAEGGKFALINGTTQGDRMTVYAGATNFSLRGGGIGIDVGNLNPVYYSLGA